MNPRCSNPVLSIVTVSAFDIERLHTTLASVVGAAGLDLEHITVIPENDLKSTDLWRKLCGHHPNFKLIFDNNSGIYPAMNLGAKNASGKFVVFWNSGELITSNSELDSLLGILSEAKSDAIVCQAEIEWLPNHHQDLDEYRGFILGEAGRFISHQTYLLRLDYFRKIGGFAENYKVVSDTELILKVDSSGSEIDFTSICPVFVENSFFASNNHRVARCEMIMVNFRHALKTKNLSRLRSYFINEFKQKLGKVASLFETRNPNYSDNWTQIHSTENRKYKSNFGRQAIFNEFISQFSSCSDRLEYEQIYVLGGSLEDPEAQYLSDKFPRAKISTLGIENSDIFLDLNCENNLDIAPADIVLVSQVLEHVWNHSSFFSEIQKITKSGGIAWIGCPASNKVHGSPDYFAAGFTNSYIKENLRKNSFEPLGSGFFGTKRLYLATHWIPGWLSVRGHRFPMLFAFDNRKFAVRTSLTLRFFMQLLVLSCTNPRPTINQRWATESWVLARKR